MKSLKTIRVAAALTPVVVIVLGFVPELHRFSAVFWLAGALLMVPAVVITARRQAAAPDLRSEVVSRRRPLLLLAIAAIGALVGGSLVAIDQAHADDRPPLAVHHITAAAPTAEQLVSATADLQVISGDAAADSIREAEDHGVRPQSELIADYSRARVFADGGSTIVTVPLDGTALPDASHLTFISSGSETTVVEMAADLVSTDRAHLAVWQDGLQTKNVLIDKAGDAQQPVPTTRGFNMDKLTKCLTTPASTGRSSLWSVQHVAWRARPPSCARRVWLSTRA